MWVSLTLVFRSTTRLMDSEAVQLRVQVIDNALGDSSDDDEGG